MNNLSQYLNNSKSPIFPLVTFRIIFGLLMFISTARFMYLGWIEDHFVNTKFQFKYFGFGWVELLSPTWMYAIHWIMLFASIGLMIGFLYRLCVIMLFFSFTYTQLIDLTYYLNHYYFVSLVLLLLCFIPAHKYGSVDSFIIRDFKSDKTASWHIDILKIQIFCVYFFAGIAKINSSWLLDALPLKIWLPANDKFPILGNLFAHNLSPYLFSWGGMLYDTFIVFFLLFSPTRKWAYILVILFHTIVGILFQIGMFPVMMIGVTLIFFSSDWHKSLIARISVLFKKKPQKPFLNLPKITFPLKLQSTLLIVFILFQLIFPLRYLLYNGNLFWNEEGYRFSWRVMLMEKAGTATFYVKNGVTGREGIVDNSEFLNAHQEKQMAFQPDMILQFAHFIGDYYAKKGVQDPQVRVKAWVTLNAKPSKLIIDPTIDLMEYSDSWKPKNWVLPFK